MRLECLNVTVNGSEFSDFGPESPLPLLHVLRVHDIELVEILAQANMASIFDLIKHLIVVHHVNVRCLFKQVHLHLHWLVQQFFKFSLPLRIVIYINLEKFTVCSCVCDSRLFKSHTVLVAQFVDLVSVKFRHQLVNKFFLNGEVVFHVVVKNFNVLKDLRVHANFFEKLLSDLVILYHPHDTHFLNSFNQDFLRQFVTSELLCYLVSLVPHLFQDQILGFFLLDKSISALLLVAVAVTECGEVIAVELRRVDL